MKFNSNYYRQNIYGLNYLIFGKMIATCQCTSKINVLKSSVSVDGRSFVLPGFWFLRRFLNTPEADGSQSRASSRRRAEAFS